MSYCVGEAGKSVVLDLQDNAKASSSAAVEHVENKDKHKGKLIL